MDVFCNVIPVSVYMSLALSTCVLVSFGFSFADENHDRAVLIKMLNR